MTLTVQSQHKDPDARGRGLTARQLEICTLASTGLSNKVIADRMGVKIHTIKCHLNSAYRRLGVRNRVQMTRAILGAA